MIWVLLKPLVQTFGPALGRLVLLAAAVALGLFVAVGAGVIDLQAVARDMLLVVT